MSYSFPIIFYCLSSIRFWSLPFVLQLSSFFKCPDRMTNQGLPAIFPSWKRTPDSSWRDQPRPFPENQPLTRMAAIGRHRALIASCLMVRMG
jgi:hypothetical protein